MKKIRYLLLLITCFAFLSSPLFAHTEPNVIINDSIQDISSTGNLVDYYPDLTTQAVVLFLLALCFFLPI